LDEIGDLAIECQPKLLRFLEAGEVLPLGESSPTQVDVRVIRGNELPISTLLFSDGRFREDHLLSPQIVPLEVPPLRERRPEVPSLARHYLNKFATQFQKGESAA
jgi:transcriptional regulator with GAF, ATPase, and Fis domain